MTNDPSPLTRRTAIKSIGGLAGVGLLGSTVSANEGNDPLVPNGPWVTGPEATNLEGFHDYEELVRRLEQAERSYDALSLDTIGTTNQGRDIYLVTADAGADEDVVIITQQHGNEPTGTEAVLINLLSFLGNQGSRAGDILDAVSVHVVPRVNPDGFEAYQRYNVDPDAPARNTGEGFYTAWQEGVGWDINRYHDPEWEDSVLYENHPDEYPENPVPEAVAVQEAVEAIDPLWIADIHNQGTYVDENNEMITSSIFWPINPGVAEEPQNLSKQLCWVMYDHVDDFGYANITQYPGGTYQGIARNGYGLRGYGSVLVEIRGGVQTKSQGYLNRTALEEMTSMLVSTADGSLYDVDPALAETIPTRTWESPSRELPPE